VADENMSLPLDPLLRLSKEERKRALEMSVFKSFASTIGIDAAPAEYGNPTLRQPDIQCTVSGKVRWFELGSIMSRDVAAKVKPSRRVSEDGFSFKQEIPFVYIVTDKRRKQYQTQGDPIELILHFDLRLGSRSVVQRQIAKHMSKLESLLTKGPFSRVWIFDEWQKSIVWSATRSQIVGMLGQPE
jgi:hypothetical protein